MKPGRRAMLFLVIPAMAALLSACGGDGDAGTAATSPATSSASGGGGVTISDFKFAPSTFTVGRRARFTVTNDDGTAHTATADDGSSFDTGPIDPGGSQTITVSAAGRYEYHCSIHSFMHATIVVT